MPRGPSHGELSVEHALEADLAELLDALLPLELARVLHPGLGLVLQARRIGQAHTPLVFKGRFGAVPQAADHVLQLADLIVVRATRLLERLVTGALGLARLFERSRGDLELERRVVELLLERADLALQLADQCILGVHLSTHARGRRVVVRLELTQLGLEGAPLLRHGARHLLLALSPLGRHLMRFLAGALHVDEGELFAYARELTLLAFLGEAVLGGTQHGGSHAQLVLQLLGCGPPRARRRQHRRQVGSCEEMLPGREHSMIALGSRRRAGAVPARRASRKYSLRSPRKPVHPNLTPGRLRGRRDTHEGQGDAQPKALDLGSAATKLSRQHGDSERERAKVATVLYSEHGKCHNHAHARALRLACEGRPNS